MPPDSLPTPNLSKADELRLTKGELEPKITPASSDDVSRQEKREDQDFSNINSWEGVYKRLGSMVNRNTALVSPSSGRIYYAHELLAHAQETEKYLTSMFKPDDQKSDFPDQQIIDMVRGNIKITRANGLRDCLLRLFDQTIEQKRRDADAIKKIRETIK